MVAPAVETSLNTRGVQQCATDMMKNEVAAHKCSTN
jgi:hypothetical protein